MRALAYISLCLLFIGSMLYLTLLYFSKTLTIKYELTGISLRNFNIKDFLFSNTPIVLNIKTTLKHESYLNITLKNVQLIVKQEGKAIALSDRFNLPLKSNTTNIIESKISIYVGNQNATVIEKLVDAYVNKKEVEFQIDFRFKFMFITFTKKGYNFKTFLS